MSRMVHSSVTGPTEEKWNSHKELLKKLYIEDGSTLDDVIATMRNGYDFRASRKMYKSRLKKWRFVKYNNFTDMQAVARMVAQDGNLSTEAKFEVAGKDIDLPEVIRYFKRKRIKTLEDAVQLAKGSSSCVNVAKRSETSGGLACGRVSAEVSDVQSRRTSTALLPSVDSITLPESIFKAIAQYYTGCCETIWYTDSQAFSRNSYSNRLTVYPIFSLRHSWEYALNLARRRCFFETRQVLARTCQDLSRIVSLDAAELIRTLLELLLGFTRAGFYDWAAAVLRHVIDASPHHHPVASLCHRMLDIELSLVESVAVTTLECGADVLEQQCGPYALEVMFHRHGPTLGKTLPSNNLKVAEQGRGRLTERPEVDSPEYAYQILHLAQGLLALGLEPDARYSLESAVSHVPADSRSWPALIKIPHKLSRASIGIGKGGAQA